MTYLRPQALTVLLVCVKSLSFLNYVTSQMFSYKMKRMDYYCWIDIKVEKRSSKYAIYLNSINLTSVAHIKGMCHE